MDALEAARAEDGGDQAQVPVEVATPAAVRTVAEATTQDPIVAAATIPNPVVAEVATRDLTGGEILVPAVGIHAPAVEVLAAIDVDPNAYHRRWPPLMQFLEHTSSRPLA